MSTDRRADGHTGTRTEECLFPEICRRHTYHTKFMILLYISCKEALVVRWRRFVVMSIQYIHKPRGINVCPKEYK